MAASTITVYFQLVRMASENGPGAQQRRVAFHHAVHGTKACRPQVCRCECGCLQVLPCSALGRLCRTCVLQFLSDRWKAATAGTFPAFEHKDTSISASAALVGASLS